MSQTPYYFHTGIDADLLDWVREHSPRREVMLFPQEPTLTEIRSDEPVYKIAGFYSRSHSLPDDPTDWLTFADEKERHQFSARDDDLVGSEVHLIWCGGRFIEAEVLCAGDTGGERKLSMRITYAANPAAKKALRAKYIERVRSRAERHRDTTEERYAADLSPYSGDPAEARAAIQKRINQLREVT